jgi:type IV pilus assembly protein PilF
MLHLQIGTAHLQKGNYPIALKNLLAAEQLDPDNIYIQNNLALAYFVRNKFLEAETHFRKALKIDPAYSEARNNLGRTLIEANRHDEAIKELTKVVEDLTYENPEKAYANLGLANFRIQRYQEAKNYLVKALVTDRGNCVTNSLFGRTLYELKDYEKACEALDKAIRFCQKDGYDEPHYYSGLCYYKAGNLDKAFVRLEETTKLYKSGQYKTEAEKMLKLLR